MTNSKKILIAILFIIIIGVIAYVFTSMRSNKQDDKNVLQNLEESVEDEFQIFVKPPTIENDDDADGISNDDEKKSGTSNTEFDTDGDGISDFDEINTWKTDPTKNDTDGDGFADGFEIIGGYNPLGEGQL